MRSFARLILGDASLADHPQRDIIYTPEPFQSGRFDWAGSGVVVAVERRGAKLDSLVKRPVANIPRRCYGKVGR